VKKRKAWPARQDSRITSQYIPDTGDIVIGVARGFAGAGEVLYKLTSEVLAGAIENRKELAVIVNNLGLLVLAQLSGFNLAESLDDLPRALAKWGHMEKEFTEVQREKQMTEALAIAQKTVHKGHGKAHEDGDGPVDSDCPCRDMSNQTICASAVGCGFCLAAIDMKAKDTDEGPRDNTGIAGDEQSGPQGVDGPSSDYSGAGPGQAVAADEFGA
jgi:hypothetical protein